MQIRRSSWLDNKCIQTKWWILDTFELLKNLKEIINAMNEYCDQYELSSECGIYALQRHLIITKIEDSDWWLSYEYYMPA